MHSATGRFWGRQGHKSGWLASGLNTIIAFPVFLNMQLHSFPPVPVAAWSWQSPVATTSQQKQRLANRMHQAGFTRLYVDITAYASYAKTPQDIQTDKVRRLTTALREQVRIFNDRGIQVHALAGDSDWASTAQLSRPHGIISYVHKYNKTVPPNERLRGIQFDIEPHTKADFIPNAKTRLRDFLAVTQQLTKHHAQLMSGAHMPVEFGFAVPFWFDQDSKDAPPLTINGRTKPAVHHLMDQLNVLSGGYIAIMDYRTTTGGSNGSIAHAKNEMYYAAHYAKNVKVVIGQEVTPVQPSTITFYWQQRFKLHRAVHDLYGAFKANPNFGGFAIHDAETFMVLK